MGLPSNWSTHYDRPTSRMDVWVKGHVLEGSRNMYCGTSSSGVHRENDKIIFESKKKPIDTKPSDMH